MPILWNKNIKTTQIMKNIEQLTQEEALLIITFQPMYSFSTLQANQLVEIVKHYIDANQQNCATCGSSLRQAKDKVINFYVNNKEVIDKIAAGISHIISDVSELKEDIILPIKNTTKRNKSK